MLASRNRITGIQGARIEVIAIHGGHADALAGAWVAGVGGAVMQINIGGEGEL